ncbi:hypothetical protein BH09PAT3_BH09PAT3_2980 [soil metagenome]
MDVLTLTPNDTGYPLALHQMHRPPTTLYYRGDFTSLIQKPRVAIVGSRTVSPYGKQVTKQIAEQLAGQGMVIVSGLAIGVDAIAHQAALSVGGLTMAVLPSPVETPLPTTNHQLAERILRGGGALVSSYPQGSVSHKGNFVERNELVAALSGVVVITEAAQKSGSLHTAGFALDLGVTVLAVPGNVTSRVSVGTNQLIKAGKAGVATNALDVLQELGITKSLQSSAQQGENPLEQSILDLIANGIHEGSELQEQSGQTISVFNQALTMLEITGKVMALGANRWGLP